MVLGLILYGQKVVRFDMGRCLMKVPRENGTTQRLTNIFARSPPLLSDQIPSLIRTKKNVGSSFYKTRIWALFI